MLQKVLNFKYAYFLYIVTSLFWFALYLQSNKEYLLALFIHRRGVWGILLDLAPSVIGFSAEKLYTVLEKELMELYVESGAGKKK